MEILTENEKKGSTNVSGHPIRCAILTDFVLRRSPCIMLRERSMEESVVEISLAHCAA